MGTFLDSATLNYQYIIWTITYKYVTSSQLLNPVLPYFLYLNVELISFFHHNIVVKWNDIKYLKEMGHIKNSKNSHNYTQIVFWFSPCINKCYYPIEIYQTNSNGENRAFYSQKQRNNSPLMTHIRSVFIIILFTWLPWISQIFF